MKKHYQKLKELWQVPRYKALIKLVIYTIFIVFVISLIKNVPEVETNTINSYEFSYKLISNQEEITIKGIHYKNKEKLIINNNIYYYVDNTLYLNKNEEIDIEKVALNTLQYENIKNSLKEDQVIDKATYSDKDVITYLVDGSNFNLLEKVNVTVEKNSNYINKVSINFNEQLENYQIEIEYFNFNKIEDLEINI